jgi:RNA polymerase sigma factor (sigma-70 family)
MASGALQQGESILVPRDAAQPTDGQLLQRFAAKQDEAAFAILVRRHGTMVLGVCRRVLDNEHDAEDAFQATFLVLARQAQSIRKLESVGSWLYGVAYRISLRARSDAARRRALEEQARTMPEQDPFVEAAWRELRPVLDEEVDRLPAKYRAPIILCYLEGKTNTEAARELGWTKGTVSGRLARARELLRTRLARRGVTVAPALLLLLLSRESLTISVSSTLVAAAVAAAQFGKAGAAVTAGVVSTRAWEWAAVVLKSSPVWRFGATAKAALAAATILLSVLCVWQLSPAWAGFFGSRHGTRSSAAVCWGSERTQLQGAWLLTSSERGGRRDHPEVLKGAKLVIELDEAIFFFKDRRGDSWRFGLDTKADHHWIDLVQGGQLRQGIYKLQDETLTLCLALPGEKRPSDFSAAPETRCWLLTYRREGVTASMNGPTSP